MAMTWQSLDLLRKNLGSIGEGVAAYLKNRQEEENQQQQFKALQQFQQSPAGQGLDNNMLGLLFNSTHDAAKTLQGAQAYQVSQMPKHSLVTQPKTGAVVDVEQAPHEGGFKVGPTIMEGTDPATQVEWVQARNPDGTMKFATQNNIQVPVLQAHDRSTKMPIPGWEKLGSASGTGINSGGESITPENMRFFAERELAGGDPPSISARDVATKKAYNNMLATVAKERGITGEGAAQNKALYKAHATTLSQLQSRLGMTKSYEGSTLNNIIIAEDMAKKYGRTQWPALNSARNWLAANVTNNPNYTALENSIYTALREYAKVVTGSFGAQGLTDAAIAEVERLANASQSPEQFAAAINVMKRDLANVPKSLQEQIDSERDLISSLLTNTSEYEKRKRGEQPAGGAVKPPAGAKVFRWNPATGKVE